MRVAVWPLSPIVVLHRWKLPDKLSSNSGTIQSEPEAVDTPNLHTVPSQSSHEVIQSRSDCRVTFRYVRYLP